jgi:CubicO group peptidase (beta-lactamase class C family)
VPAALRSIFPFATLILACAATAPRPVQRPAAETPAAIVTSIPDPFPAEPEAQTFAATEPAPTFADRDRKKKLEAGFAAIDEIAADEMARQKIPGLVVGVVIDGELAYSKGFGYADVEKKTKPDLDTVFRIGSITKSFTALATLALRDDGALALDDTLTSFVPEASRFVYPTRDAPPITLRQLLTHTSGLPRTGNLTDPKATSESDIMKALSGQALENVPGTTFVYSNLGFGLLGIAAGRAAHASLREVMGRRILVPLGMTATTWDRAAVTDGRLATGYEIVPPGEARPAEDPQLGATEGAGGLYSSVRDLARYLAAQLDAYPPRNAAETGPVRRSTVRESHSTGFHSGLSVSLAEAPKKGDTLVRASAESYGFGWASAHTCDFDDLVWHNGSIKGYTADIRFLRQRGVGVVTLANLTPGNPSAVSQRVLLALKRTGGLSKRSSPISPAFEPAMKKLLDVYNTWDETHYKAMLRAGRAPVSNEKEELLGYKLFHGACKGFSPIEARTPLDAKFNLDCERGPFEMRVILWQADGLIDGFMGTTRDAPIPKPVRLVVEQVTQLIGKWDDGIFKRHLANAHRARDATAASFEALRAVHGACKLKSSTVEVFDRTFVLSCERGGDLTLALEVDKKDPNAVTSYAFRTTNDELCPVR